MVVKLLATAGATLALIGPVSAWGKSGDMLVLTAHDMASTEQAMTALSLTANQASPASQSSQPQIAAPEVSEFPELLVSYSNAKHHAHVELGALGGGRADAPGLVHVGLEMNF